MGIAADIPLRFSKLPCAPWMSHYHGFSRGYFSLLNKTHTYMYIQTHEKQCSFTLITSSHAPLNGSATVKRVPRLLFALIDGKQVWSTGMRSV